MDIQQFVRETLCQILNGVDEANAQHGNVNPDYELEGKAVVPSNTVVDTGGQLVFMVEFDLAVTAAEQTEQSGTGRLNIQIVSAGGGKSSGSTLTSVTRVRFSVPITYRKEN